MFRAADAHVNYVDEAYDVYGSYGVPKERIFVTRNSPDTDYLLKTAAEIEGTAPILPPCACRVMHVGRLVEWKRVDLLLEAVSELAARFPEI